MHLRIRDARREDVPALMSMIRELATYERLADEVVGSEAELETHLFGGTPTAFALLAEVSAPAGDGGDAPSGAGCAIYFTNFSTFLTRPGLYLEDLFVRPEYRKRGIGLALLRALARRAVDMNAARVEWAVLDWNEDAISFYERLGARANDGWRTYRLAGEALERLADDTGP